MIFIFDWYVDDQCKINKDSIKKNRKIRKRDSGRKNYSGKTGNKISINFINNLYIGVNEASYPLSHHKLSTTSSPVEFSYASPVNQMPHHPIELYSG